MCLTYSTVFLALSEHVTRAVQPPQWEPLLPPGTHDGDVSGLITTCGTALLHLRFFSSCWRMPHVSEAAYMALLNGSVASLSRFVWLPGTHDGSLGAT
mmetsp:Transcript_61599/g.146961  ORF Transcript_61599/g.146961 Transcript_61599/m.146961 type:complete len:98 (+) Transcript_61599:1018-1311(+)